jgi:hypothetical protein
MTGRHKGINNDGPYIFIGIYKFKVVFYNKYYNTNGAKSGKCYIKFKSPIIQRSQDNYQSYNAYIMLMTWLINWYDITSRRLELFGISIMTSEA